MKSWDLTHVKPEDEVSFIIGCLEDYVHDVEEMPKKISEDEMKRHYPDLLEVSALYRAIIKHLKSTQQ